MPKARRPRPRNLTEDDLPAIPALPPHRLQVYTRVSELLQDAFWRSVLQDTPSDTAIYAYCVLSGMGKHDAAALALNGEVEDMAGVIRRLDVEAMPVFRRGMLAGAVNELWMVRIIKEIGEDVNQPAGARLEAVKLAGQFLGKLQAPSQRLEVDVNINGRVELQQRVDEEIRRVMQGIMGGMGSGGGRGGEVEGGNGVGGGGGGGRGTGLQIPRVRVVEGEAEAVTGNKEDGEREDDPDPAD